VSITIYRLECVGNVALEVRHVELREGRGGLRAEAQRGDLRRTFRIKGVPSNIILIRWITGVNALGCVSVVSIMSARTFGGFFATGTALQRTSAASRITGPPSRPRAGIPIYPAATPRDAIQRGRTTTCQAQSAKHAVLHRPNRAPLSMLPQYTLSTPIRCAAAGGRLLRSHSTRCALGTLAVRRGTGLRPKFSHEQ
jgi:hypothetical protein